VSADADRPGNSLCILVNSLQSGKSSAGGTSAAIEPTMCSSNADCWGWKQCKQKSCVLPDKTCESDCSSNGVCMFRDEKLSVDVKSCKVGDSSCTAYCVCDSKHVGSACSKTLEDMKACQEVRGQLLLGLHSITKSEDVSPESLTSWFSNLGAITSKTDEISLKGGNTVAQVLSTIVTSMEDKKMIVPPASTVALMGSLNNNIAFSKKSGTSARRRHLSASSSSSGSSNTTTVSTGLVITYPEYLQKPMDVISRYGEILVSDMVIV